MHKSNKRWGALRICHDRVLEKISKQAHSDAHTAGGMNRN